MYRASPWICDLMKVLSTALFLCGVFCVIHKAYAALQEILAALLARQMVQLYFSDRLASVT